MNAAYRAAGVRLPATLAWSAIDSRAPVVRGLGHCAADGACRCVELGASGDLSDAFASGWMQLRGTTGARRRRSGLRASATMPIGPVCSAPFEPPARERVIVTHGHEAVMVRWLREQGLQAGTFATPFGAAPDGDADPVADSP